MYVFSVFTATLKNMDFNESHQSLFELCSNETWNLKLKTSNLRLELRIIRQCDIFVVRKVTLGSWVFFFLKTFLFFFFHFSFFFFFSRRESSIAIDYCVLKLKISNLQFSFKFMIIRQLP